MDKYAQMKRCHHDRRLQVNIYYFMHVDPKTMTEEDYHPATIFLLKTTIQFQL